MSYELDEVDFRIIRSLSEDARKTISQIAKEADISRPTAIRRLEKLRKNDVIRLGARVNVKKLGFKLALMVFKTNGSKSTREVETDLAVCPRVLMLMHTSGNPNYFALLYSENMETLVSVIECFKSFASTRGMEIVSWHPSNMSSKSETFDLKFFPMKNELTLCGKKCGDCSSYQNQECLGCPAVTEYKGPL